MNRPLVLPHENCIHPPGFRSAVVFAERIVIVCLLCGFGDGLFHEDQLPSIHVAPPWQLTQREPEASP